MERDRGGASNRKMRPLKGAQSYYGMVKSHYENIIKETRRAERTPPTSSMKSLLSRGANQDLKYKGILKASKTIRRQGVTTSGNADWSNKLEDSGGVQLVITKSERGNRNGSTKKIPLK